MKTNVLLHQA